MMPTDETRSGDAAAAGGVRTIHVVPHTPERDADDLRVAFGEFKRSIQRVAGAVLLLAPLVAGAASWLTAARTDGADAARRTARDEALITAVDELRKQGARRDIDAEREREERAAATFAIVDRMERLSASLERFARATGRAEAAREMRALHDELSKDREHLLRSRARRSE